MKIISIAAQVRDGKKTEEAKVPFKTDKKKSRTFQIVVTPNRIVHQIQQGNGWASLDSWNQSGGSVSSGKFGFYLPGSDEVEGVKFQPLRRAETALIGRLCDLF